MGKINWKEEAQTIATYRSSGIKNNLLLVYVYEQSNPIKCSSTHSEDYSRAIESIKSISDGDKEIIQKLENFFEKRLAAEGLSQESESFKRWASVQCNNQVGCNQVWDNFQETKDPNLRYCKFCQKNVQSCNTIEELDTCIANNQCVCIRIYESDGRDSNYVGKFPDYFVDEE